MPEVVVFVGLQGSGKSSYFRANYATTHDLVSKDLFRNNRQPQRRQEFLVRESLSAGRSVVIDNTNPTKEERAALVRLAREFGARPVCCVFHADVKDCIRRNAVRTGKAKVPNVAIFTTRKKMQPVEWDEGFDEILDVHLTEDNRFELTPRAR